MNTTSGALERCVGDAEAFLRDVWGVGPLFRPATAAAGFDDLLSLADVDRVISTMSLRVPFFRVVKDGATIPRSSYTTSGRTGSISFSGVADPPRIHRLFGEGATIVLQGLQRFWAPLTRFCRDLELALGHPAQANAYITPAGAAGLAVHHDPHDVFVLQVSGHKAWEVFEPGGEERPAVLSLDMGPGDCLYLPIGTPHAARTQASASAHLTIGVTPVTWADVLGDVLGDATREEAFEERVPAGYHRDAEGFAAALRERIDELARWLGKADAGEAAERRVRRFLTTRRPLVDGGLQALVGLDRINDATPMLRRDGSVLELRVDGDRLLALLGDRELRMPAGLEDAMGAIAGWETFAVRDLAPFLEPESRLVLVRRLVREGLLEVSGGG